jgi:Outer membrane protein beta-barrel domain
MKLVRIFAASLALTALSVLPARAQASTAPTGGFELGLSMSNVSPEAPGQSISRAPGLLAGAYVFFPAFTAVGIQAEFVYAQKYTHLSSTSDMKIDDIEIPILAKLKLFKSAYLLEGVAISFPVRARIQPSSGAEQDIKSQVTSPDVGIVIGGGVPVGKAAIEARYEGGFRNVISTTGAAAQRSRSLSVLVRFHL